MTRLRVGFLGLGRIFDLHLLGYRDDPEIEIAALCANDPTTLAERGAANPGAARHTDIDRFLKEGLDLVEVLTPHPLHAAHAAAALAAGAHVSVQKPMAMSLTEADAMTAAARTAGRRLRVYENFVFYPPLVKARELLMSGAIGKPLHCRMRTLAANPTFGWSVKEGTWRWRAKLFEEDRVGRLTFDDGHHKMAVALWLFGPVRDVFARIDETPSATGSVDAPASIAWRHRDPAVHGIWDIIYAPRMQVRSDYYALDEVFEITGETGIITVSRATGRRLQTPVLTLYRDGATTSFHDIDDDWGSSFRLATRALVDHLRGRAPAPALTAVAGRAVLEFALAIRESAARGAPVALPLEPSS
jgi:predicted dehydrogenase